MSSAQFSPHNSFPVKGCPAALSANVARFTLVAWYDWHHIFVRISDSFVQDPIYTRTGYIFCVDAQRFGTSNSQSRCRESDFACH